MPLLPDNLTSVGVEGEKSDAMVRKVMTWACVIHFPQVVLEDLAQPYVTSNRAAADY
jgi:hypothetical protein